MSENKPKSSTKTSKRDPLPKGWLTPSGFAKDLSNVLSQEIRPQRIYGYVKTGKDFPYKTHSDGRVILDHAKALKWYKEMQAGKAANREMWADV